MMNIDHNLLSGVRVLVVEDDPLLIMDIESTLTEAGAVVVDACRTVRDAVWRSNDADFSVAILDFRIGSETVSPVARRLADRGVPFVIYTGQARDEAGLAEWLDRSIVEKPAAPQALVSAVREALASQ